MVNAVLAAALWSALASHAYLIGNWNCSYTVGKTAGTYTTTWDPALDGRWLTQSIDQPGAFKSSYLVGYDEKRRGWVRFGAMTTGQYFAIRMNDDGRGGWIWNYISFFSSVRRTRPGGDAAFKRVSDTRYVIDGPTYPENGTIVTEHHVCSKR